MRFIMKRRGELLGSLMWLSPTDDDRVMIDPVKQLARMIEARSSPEQLAQQLNVVLGGVVAVLNIVYEESLSKTSEQEIQEARQAATRDHHETENLKAQNRALRADLDALTLAITSVNDDAAKRREKRRQSLM